MKRDVAEFFEEFQQASDTLDATRSAKQFAEVFLHSDPEGVHAITNEDFVQLLPARKAFFDRLGLRSSRTRLASAEEVGEAYVLARTTVDMQFDKNGTTVDLHQTASYLLKKQRGTFVIIAYLNDQLLNALLAQKGLSA